MRPTIDKGVLGGIALLAAMIVGIGTTSYLNTRALRDHEARATESRKFVDAVAAVRYGTRHLQAAQRSYLLTGFPDWRPPYDDAVQIVRGDMQRLVELTAKDAEQNPRALAAAQQLATGIASLNSVVEMRAEPDGYAKVIQLSQERGPRSFVDPLLQILAEMDQVERQRLTLRDREASDGYRRAIIYGILATLLGLAGLAVLGWLVRESAIARARDAERLANQRELLNATLSSIADGVIATDESGNVTFLNSVAEELTGWSQNNAVGLPLERVFSIINESTRLSLENPTQRALKEGVIVGLANHTLLIARDGTERPIDNSAAPIRTRGIINGAVLVFRDISERKQAMDELRTSEVRRRLALDAAQLGSWNIDPATNLLVSDDRFREIFHGSTRPISYEDAFDVIHPDDRERIRRGVAAAINPLDPALYAEQYRVVHPNGEIHWVDARGRANFSGEGAQRTLTSFDGTVADITTRKIAEEQVHDARARLDATLSAGEVATWTWDIKANRVIADRNLARFFGVTEEQASGGPIQAYIQSVHPDDQKLVENEIQRAFESQEAFEAIYRLLPPNGSERTVIARGKPEYDAHGLPVRFPGVVLDITRQIEAEKELRTSEHRLRVALKAGRMGTWDLDLTQNMLSCSDACKAIYGRKPEEPFRYEDLAASVHSDDKARWSVVIQEAIHRTGEFELEYRIRWPEGEMHWVHMRGNCLPPVDGQPTAMSGVSFDITERKRAEERERQAAVEAVASAEANAKYRTFFEQGSYFAGVMSLDGILVEANRLCLEACGFSRDDVIGKPFWECGWWSPSATSAQIVQEGFAQASTGITFRQELPYFVANGSSRIVELTMSPVTDDTGRVLFVAPTGVDITDRKRADDAVQFLADASASLAELVDYESTLARIANIAVGKFADWCVVDVLDDAGNRRRLSVTRKETATISNARANDAQTQATEIDSAGIPHVLKTGEPEVVPDLSAIDPETSLLGADRIARLRHWGIHSYLCVPLLSHGRVIGGMTFLGASPAHRYGADQLRVAQELAQRVTAAIENAGLYRTLQEQDRRKDEFLAMLAHELRNPLAPVRHGIQILKATSPKHDLTSETLGMMDRQLVHMVHMVDDLLDVARVSSGKVVLRKERVDLQTIVAGAVETSRALMEQSRHELTLHLPDEPLWLDVDRTRVSQILANLLNNAAKYTPPEGRIELQAERVGTNAVIKVMDNGIGIPPELLASIFEMFTQVGASLDRAQGGLGIGLTLVKRLVDLHGGTVVANSKGLGMGSEFIVRLPINLPGEQAHERDNKKTENKTFTGKPVLVVDDNRDAAESLALLLRIKGHEVQTAPNGPDALRILETFRPSLIMLDLGLPGMNGYEVAHKIRESDSLKGITLAALTGWGQDEDRRRTKEAGFDHHLVKPADIEAIEAILDGLNE